MNSFNNIERFKYTKNQEDVVSLSEYIVFEDERAQEKYAVLKLTNNLNQPLYEVELEISQYDRKDNLVEKVVVSYDNFKARANETFVPNAKVKLNYLCKTISVRLVFAKFERVKFEQNELVDLNRVFKDYKATLETNKEIVVHKTVIENPIKKAKRRFSLKDTTKKNRVVFPIVFNVIISIVICIASAVTSYVYTKNNTNRFSYGGFDYELVGDNYLSIIKYDGLEKDVTIPTHILYNNVDREIIKINQYAFKNSRIKSITLYNNDITIDRLAFYNCDKLTTVNIMGTANLVDYSFYHCDKLNYIDMKYSYLTRNAFSKSYNISYLAFGNCRLNNLQEAFDVEDGMVMHFDTVITTQMNEIRYSFVENNFIGTLYVSQNCYIDTMVGYYYNVQRFYVE